MSKWKLVEANSDKRPNRTDHTLTWQQIAPLDPENSAAKDPSDHAYARVDVQILGDEPANYRTYIKIPEEFTRQQEQLSLSRTVFQIGKAALLLALVVCVLVIYFKHLRAEPAGTVPWRRLSVWAAGGCLAFLVSFLLGKGIPTLLMQYQTAIPLRMFFGIFSIGIFIITAVILGGLLLVFGLGWSFGARAFGAERIPVWLGMPGEYYRDAFWIALGGTAVVVGVKRFLGALDAWWPTLHRGLPAAFGGDFDAIYPAASVIGVAMWHSLFLTGTFALAASFLGAELRVRWLRLVLFFAVAAALVSDWGNTADFLKQFLASLLVLGIVVFGIRRVARFNLLGCFLVAASGALLAGAVGDVQPSRQVLPHPGVLDPGSPGSLVGMATGGLADGPNR